MHGVAGLPATTSTKVKIFLKLKYKPKIFLKLKSLKIKII